MNPAAPTADATLARTDAAYAPPTGLSAGPSAGSPRKNSTGPAFFRRLFKRLTAFTPGAYRQRFRVPAMPEVA